MFTAQQRDSIASTADPESTVALIDNALIPHVEETLASYLAHRRATIVDLTEELAEALDALITFVLSGGKRIRPTFAWWGWRCACTAPSAEYARDVLRAISALELIQACALVHDDVMDASAVRRGEPSTHVAFANIHREQGWLGPPERFGLAAAILLGDLALAWADDLFYGTTLPADRRAAAGEAWSGMRSEMLTGQYLDVLTQARGDESPGAPLRVARWKTAAYTVERPLHMGAALGGADATTITLLRAFGADIGVAFQLRDDLLGMFGTTEQTGKPAGDDLREGKRTLLMAEAVTRANQLGRETEARLLRESLGRQGLGDAHVERIKNVLVDLGAVGAIERRIAALTESAMAALRSADLAEPAAKRLADLAIAATRRNH